MDHFRTGGVGLYLSGLNCPDLAPMRPGMRDDSVMRVAPHGSWPSPISASDVARARIRLSFPTVKGEDVWWQETRPEEGGRTTVMFNGHELLPAPWNARTRVHEY